MVRSLRSGRDWRIAALLPPGYRPCRPYPAAVLHPHDLHTGVGVRVWPYAGHHGVCTRERAVSALQRGLSAIDRRSACLSSPVARVGLGNVSLAHELAQESRIVVVYDGDCPLCSSYTRMLRLGNAVG